MKGKHVVVTGATSGIGRSSCFMLAGQGAELTLLCRNMEKASELCDELHSATGHRPEVIQFDMKSLDSVRSAANALLASERAIDVLLNNAGVVNLKRHQTIDGFEETLAVNHFAPFLLTGIILPLLHKSPKARIVNVASEAHAFVRSMHFEDMQAEKKYRVFREYGRSKLANILFTQELARRLSGNNITVNSLHPGAVATALGKNNSGPMASLLPFLLRPFFLSPDEGAATSVYLCSSEEVGDISGEYFAKSRKSKARAWALDEEAARRLWQYTEDTVNFEYPL
jgi:retinol dehydrogenase 12